VDDVRVRAASEADLPTVEALRDAFYSEFPPPAWRDESWEAHVDDISEAVRDSGVLLAEAAGEAIGYAIAWSEGEAAVKLGDLYVRPNRRGTGVGRVLVRAVAELARSRGAAYVHLTANPEALAFYERLPFAEESRNLFAEVDRLLSK